MPSSLKSKPGIANPLRRNVAIIAHVDHGKTTLVDAMLHQSGIFRANERVVERVMDSNDLERERGITILAKNTAVHYQDMLINIVDTPGHADFGGEVERTLAMVDGVVLLVDASEGPLPQTRFVLRKALARGSCRWSSSTRSTVRTRAPTQVLDEIYDLFIDLDATEEQIEFPVLYTNARAGDVEHATSTCQAIDLRPLFDAIVEHVPPPRGDVDGAAAAAGDQPRRERLPGPDRHRPHLQRHASASAIRWRCSSSKACSRTRRSRSCSRSKGSSAWTSTSAGAGDIVCVAGIDDITIGETIADPEHRLAIPPTAIDEPTVSMIFGVNTSPMAGPRRAVRHLAQPARSARQGAARQRLAARRDDRDARADEGRGPRRAAAVDPDRDDAARGVRAAGVAARDRHQGDRRRAHGAGRRARDRRARGLPGRGHRARSARARA